ncbi:MULTISPECIES: hypothetical protein [unclassified Pseudomonas]|uniref:hypothetical protein n=1 Tax=unclassified Pseudomonas TaxID=196821 RepID=UPI000A1EA9C0|nr:MULTISPECIES: hypothetical protein [unclassified Pseudomonas]MDI2143792.1 hypothetical protein [Pseudomonas sp. ITA]
MRPKNPSLPTPSRINTSADPLAHPPRLRPQVQPPPLHHSLSGNRTSGHDQPPTAIPGPSRIEVSDLPDLSQDSATTLNSYVLSPGLLRNMQPANEEGLRFVVGRKFVDVKGIGTVHVEFDTNLGTYRATDLYKKLTPGPALYRNVGEMTWSPARQADSGSPGKRPLAGEEQRTEATPAKQQRATSMPAQLKAATSELLGVHFAQLYPQMNHGERVMELRSYNLSPLQHVRLRDDLIAHPSALPEWVVQHKARSLNIDDSARYDALHQEIEPLLLPLRNGKLLLSHLGDYGGFSESISRDFLDGFLAKLGYLRNGSDCLYRTDFPALFRADERTPFEFYNDGRMLPRLKHPRGATTEKPISATVSLKLVHEYAGRGTDSPDPEYLRYNNQKNKYPGRKPGESDNESGESDNDWSDASDVELDSERNYETMRHAQQVIFTYVIDTRKMEVVLGEENHLLNNAARKNGAWFPEDEIEALISTSKRGIEAERLWMLDSTFTRAAKVEDIAEQADYDSRIHIEERTHQGVNNRHQYDALIDKVAQAGKPVLTLDKGKEWFANDIVWPE